MSSSEGLECQEFTARVPAVNKHLPAVGFLVVAVVLTLKPSLTHTHERVREPRLGSTSLHSFERLPNIWDLFKHMIC